MRNILASPLGQIVLHWLPGLVLVTMVAGLVYGTAQHSLRAGADDPQIQLAEDTAAALAGGQTPQAVIPATKVNMAASLAPYLMIFDAQGRLIASSVQLNGGPPILPSGVFAEARQRGELRFTWSPDPQAGVRSAVVVAPVTGPAPGFVLAGRSLREVEKREDDLLWLTTVAWLAGLGLTGVASGLLVWSRTGAGPLGRPPAAAAPRDDRA